MRDRSGVQTRIIATLVCLIVAGVVRYLAALDPSKSWEWLSGVSCGLIVLGAAGIWVSFFAERQAAKTITQNIDSRFTIIGATLRARIADMFYDPDNCRGDVRYQNRIKDELDKAEGEVRLLAVAGREFFFPGYGFAFKNMERLVSPGRHGRNVSLRTLLLHPLCEAALSRGLREDPDRTFDTYDRTCLWVDITRSCTTLLDWHRHDYHVQSRLYKVSPACFLLFVNDVLFAEFYHFGTGGRASGKVPLIEVVKGSEIYCQLEGHFEYVWQTAKSFEVNESLFENLKRLDRSEWRKFKTHIEFCRPDLFERASPVQNIVSEPSDAPAP